LRDPRLDGHGEDRWRSLAGVLPRDVTAYCPTHGWTHFTRDVAGPSGTAAPPSRTPSPMAVSTVRSPSPPGARGGRVASPTPSGFERQGTIAARRGAPPLDISNAAPLHPSPPPPAWFPARRNATAAANRRPGLILTGSTEQWWGSGPKVRGWRIWARLRWIRRDPSRIDGGAPGSGGIVAIGGGSRRCGLCGCCNRCLSQASCCCVHTAAAGALLGQLGWKRWWIRIVSSPSLNYHLFVFSKFSITQYLYVLAMCLLVVKYCHQ
jgi:hypothetical protein